MLARPRSLALLGALAGAAAWFACGVMATSTEGTRAGLLPSVWLLAPLTVCGAIGARAWWPRALPPALLALPLIPVLAWMGPGEVSLAWTGALALVPWLLVAGGVIASTVQRPSLNVGHAPLVAAALSACWMGLVAWAIHPQGFTGDEPHYLLIGDSVWRDGDLDLANNYDQRHHAPYFEGSLEPRHIASGWYGEAYPFHAPGAALLVLPAYLVGGPVAVRLWLVLIVAAALAIVWSTAFRVTSSSSAAWAAWAGIALPAPLAIHGSRVYPDGPAAFVVAVALWLLVRLARGERASPTTLVLTGAALTTLPWLHLRLGLVAAVLGLALVLALRRHEDRGSAWALLLAVPVVGAALLFAASLVMFGTLDPTAPFRQRDAGAPLAAVPAGVLGMLVDQEFGLLPYAPGLALCATGFVALWRRVPEVAGTVATAVGGTLLLGGAWAWWGGQSAPARFIVPVLPALGLVLAAWWIDASAHRRAAMAALTALAAIWTLLLASAERGALVFNHPDGHGTLFEWLSANVDLSLALPSLFRPGTTAWSEATVAAVWIAAGLLGLTLLNRLSRGRAWGWPTAWTAGSAMLIAWVSAGIVAGWAWRGASPSTPDRAALALLHAAPRPWLQAGVVARAPWLTSRDAALGQIGVRAGRHDEDSVVLHVPFVPAGRYSVEMQDATRGDGLWHVELGRDAWPLAGWSPGAGALIRLPLSLRAIRVLGPPADAYLRPHHVETAWPPFQRTTAWRGHRWGDRMLYEFDPRASVESGGLWAPGDQSVPIAMTDLDGGPAGGTWWLEAGPAGVGVRLTRGTWVGHLSLAPFERRRIKVPPGSIALEPVVIAVTGGFDASHLRPGSGDRRWLGVFVSVER